MMVVVADPCTTEQIVEDLGDHADLRGYPLVNWVALHLPLWMNSWVTAEVIASAVFRRPTTDGQLTIYAHFPRAQL